MAQDCRNLYKQSVNEMKYLEAENLLKNKGYLAAKKLFMELHTYSDSAERASECQYAYAESLLAQQKYKKAKEAFEESVPYKDSAMRVKECDYMQAEQYWKEDNFSLASQYFYEADDYLDAKQRGQEAEREGYYRQVVTLIDQNVESSYAEAARILYINDILDYKDARNLYVKCRMTLVDLFVEKEAYQDAETHLKILALLDDEESKTHLNAYCMQLYGIAEDHLANNRHQSACDLMSLLSKINYSDSSERSAELMKLVNEQQAAE